MASHKKRAKDTFGSQEIYDREVDAWIDDNEKVRDPKTKKLKFPQKSNTRTIICESLATMNDYRFAEGYDCQSHWIDGIADIMPPVNSTVWGSAGKPKDFFRQMARLVGGGLADWVYPPGTPDTPDIGTEIIGIELNPAGMIYAHRNGRPTRSDVVDYWAWTQEWREHPTSNVWHLGGIPHVEDGDFQFSTKAFNSKYLQNLRVDDDVRRRYSAIEWSGDDIGRLVAKSWARDAVAVYRLLEEPERLAIITDTLDLMGVPDWLIEEQASSIQSLKTPAGVINRLVRDYAKARPLDPNDLKFEPSQGLITDVSEAVARMTIDELFGRAGWIIAQRVMRYRVNDNSAQVLGRFGAEKDQMWRFMQDAEVSAAKVDEARRAFEASTKPLREMEEVLKRAVEEHRLALKAAQGKARKADEPKPKPQVF